MSQTPQLKYRSRLLAVLDVRDFALLQPHLAPVALTVGEVLIAPFLPITEVYFIERGIVSHIITAADGEQIELALAGREGMVGAPALLGADRTPHEARVQASGVASAMPVSALRAAFAQSASLRDRVLRYTQAVTVQIASTALANGRYKVEQRLARWLLMCHDRVDGDVLPTTQRFLSVMLGVNRTGLTETLATLMRAGTIETKRGNITILDRAALLALAGSCYGGAEAEYERLIGEVGDPT